MKKPKSGRSTRAAVPSVTSTWHRIGARGQIQVASEHLEKEQVLDNAYDEYCRIKNQGDPITATQFCNRYPSYRKSLRRLIDVHEALADCPNLEEEWPELFSDFMGFEILHELGVGAIARVYLAAETALGGRLVAVKVSPMGSDEAETLGKLSHHNIVPVHSVQQDPDTGMTAICMPYYGSATLADLLDVGFEKQQPPERANIILKAARQREQLVGFVDSPEDSPTVDRVLEHGSYVDGVVHLALQMAAALEYTHEHGILHRDLKPSNVLLTPEGMPMLLDFNLATDIEMEVPRLGGTLPYMPPEQIWDVHLTPYEADLAGDPRSDVFSLAVILYELLTGTLPFGDPPSSLPPKEAAQAYLAAQQQPITPIRQLNPAVSRTVAKTIKQCLSLDIEARPSSATELVQMLQRHFNVTQRAFRYLRRIRPLLFCGFALALFSTATLLNSLADREPLNQRIMSAAKAALLAGDYQAAIAHYDELESLEQHANYRVRLGRGYARWQTGEFAAATEDLHKAYQLTRDPVILDAAAYAAVKGGNHAHALDLYARGSHASRDEPALRHLSVVELALRMHKPHKSGQGASRAIANQVHPQVAHHLNAIHTVEMHDRNFVNVGGGPIQRAVQSIDLALALGPVYPRLRYDALRVFALALHYSPDDTELLDKLQQQTRLAIEEGISPERLDDWPYLAEFIENQPWFVKLAAGAPAEDHVSISECPVDLLAKPARAEILERLNKADYDPEDLLPAEGPAYP